MEGEGNTERKEATKNTMKGAGWVFQTEDMRISSLGYR